MALRRLAIGLMLLSGSAHAAEHDFPAPPRAAGAEERFSFSLGSRTGLVKAPFVTQAFPEVSGFASVLTGDVAMQLSSLGWLHLRLPISLVRLDFPAKAQVGEAALGNLELGAEHRLELQPSTHLGMVAALLAPTAQYGTQNALLDNRALALASALNGGKDAALLTPGVLGVRLGASVEHWHGAFGFRASLDVPLLLRVSDANLPEATETHPLGLMPALDVQAAWWSRSWFGASLGAGLVTEPLRVQEPTLDSDRDQRLQPLVEPALHARIGQRFRLTLDGSIPVGGSLGGDAWSIGLRARLGL